MKNSTVCSLRSHTILVMSRSPEFELFIAALEELDRLLATLAYYSGGLELL